MNNSKIDELIVKSFQNEPFSEEEKEFIESYKNEDKFNTLSSADQQKILVMQSQVDSLKKTQSLSCNIMEPKKHVKTINPKITISIMALGIFLSTLCAYYLNTLI